MVEDGEECDQGFQSSSCCESCKLTTGSECEVHLAYNLNVKMLDMLFQFTQMTLFIGAYKSYFGNLAQSITDSS